MSDAASFTAAVRADPADDGPRLVYADWLEERGDVERARFVRLQCEAGRLPWGTVKRIELERRADDLRLEHEEDWLGPWRDRLVRWRWFRGFVHEATLTADAFHEHGSDLFAEQLVDRIGFVDGNGDPLGADAVPDIVAHRAFERVRSLDVLGATPIRPAMGHWHSEYREPTIPVEEWLRAIAGNERLVNFREFRPAALIRRFNPFTETSGIEVDAIEAFCRAPHLSNVTAIDLRGCPLAVVGGRDRIASLVAEAPFAANLRRWGLEPWEMTDEGLQRIESDPVFARLRRLDLGGYGHAFSAATRLALFTSETLRSLRAVTIDESELAAYASSPLAKRVRSLTINGDFNERHPPDAVRSWQRLIDHGRPPTRLEIVCYDPGREVLESLEGSPWLSRVRSFVINNDSQSPGLHDTRPITRLLQSNSFPAVTRMRLHEFADGQFLEPFTEWPGLANLERLELTDDYSGRFGLSLLESEHLGSRIESLAGLRVAAVEDVDRIAAARLGGVRECSLGFIGDLEPADIERLFASPALRDLETLSTAFNPYDEEVAGMPGKVYRLLANPTVLPRLRTVISWMDDGAGGIASLRERLGPGLKR